KLKLKEKLNYRIEVLENKIQRLEQDLKKSNISLNSDIKGIDYSKDKIQSGIVVSVIESELERAIENLEKELKQTRVKLIKTKIRLNQVEESIANIEFAITQLSEEAKKIIELRYGTYPKLSNRKRKEIVEAIAKWMNIS
ncbi:MAG: hypothetical protein N2486_10725, partial [Caloramator sp.]|nr:hypothetical protein [Caloramator sp.]